MIKILIVDDSLTEVALIRHIIESENDMMVIGVANNGREAVELTAQLKPDLITMDIKMPVMDGLEATRQIMSLTPTPIVVISSTVSDESTKATFPILEAGALTALAKPTNVLSASFEESRKHIVDILRTMSQVNVVRKPHEVTEQFQALPYKPISMTPRNYEIVAIGASVGGPLALKTILSELPVDFPVPILIVQHISFGFIGGFVQWLSENIHLKVKIADNDEILQKATVYIAPEKIHLEIEKKEGILRSKLVKSDPVSGFCPSITVLLGSVAKVSGNRAIGMLLTGMSIDGSEGLLELKKANGHTIIQDPNSAVVFGMAGVAQSLGAVDEIVRLDNIAPYLTKIINKSGV